MSRVVVLPSPAGSGLAVFFDVRGLVEAIAVKEQKAKKGGAR